MSTKKTFPGQNTSRIHLSIILPAYNEGLHIYANILKICDALKTRDFEIIVVDDGSSDNTFSESKRAAKNGRPVKTVQLESNRGKGASLFRGFEEIPATPATAGAGVQRPQL